ncbi:MAG: HAD-IA family hydrolase [Anaerolineales bacterium]|nr:HAD-IA family hydrolase [Anaerolineales bacterium]
MIDALIFDFDGTIFDSETPDFYSWQRTYAEHGVELSFDVWAKHIGTIGTFDPYHHLNELVGRPLDRETVRRQRKVHDHALLSQQTVLPGVHAYLSEARGLGLKVGVASSSDHGWVDGYLAKLGLAEAFDVVMCRDDVGNRPKPDPAVYVAAAGALGVAPQRALALEDSPNGLMAAKRAGLYCVVVPNEMTRLLDFATADHRLGALTEMPLAQLIARLVE